MIAHKRILQTITRPLYGSEPYRANARMALVWGRI